MSLIPRNRGTCTSVPEPYTLPDIVEDLFGTTLWSVEANVIGGQYSDVDLDLVLPQDGAVTVVFSTEMAVLELGAYCFRAKAMDSSGDMAFVEKCAELLVTSEPTASPTSDSTASPTSSSASDQTSQSSAAPTEAPTVLPTHSPTAPRPMADETDS